jgi:hypothetical protein
VIRGGEEERRKVVRGVGWWRNGSRPALLYTILTSVPPAYPPIISLLLIGERSDRSRRTPHPESIDLEKKLSPDSVRVGCAADPPWLPSPIWNTAKARGVEGVPVCSRSVHVSFGADRLQLCNVRREVQMVGSRLCSRDLPSSIWLLDCCRLGGVENWSNSC